MVELNSTAVSESSLLGVPQGTLDLRIHGTSLDGRILRVRSQKCSVGAAAECGIRIRSEGARPVHCVILRGREGVLVRRWAPDTLLNGQTFQEAWLKPGDRLTVGPVEFDVLESVDDDDVEDVVTESCSEEPTDEHRRRPRKFGRRDWPQSQSRPGWNEDRCWTQQFDMLQRQLDEVDDTPVDDTPTDETAATDSETPAADSNTPAATSAPETSQATSEPQPWVDELARHDERFEQESQKWRDEREELIAMIDGIRAQLNEKADRENAEQDEEVERLRSEIRNQAERIESLSEESTANRLIAQSLAEHESLLQQQQELAEANETRLRVEIAELTKELGELKTSFKDHEPNVDQVELLNEQLLFKDDAIASLQMEKRDLTQRLQKCEGDLSEQQVELELTQERLLSIEKQYEQGSNEIASERAHYESLLSEANEDALRRRNEFEQRLQEVSDTAAAQVAEYESRLTEANKLAAEQQAEFARQLESAESKAIEQIEEVQSRFDAARGDASRADELEQRLEASEERFNDERNRLTAQLDESRRHLTRLERERDEQAGELNVLRRDFELAEQRTAEAKHDREEMIQQLITEKSSVEQELERLQQQSAEWAVKETQLEALQAKQVETDQIHQELVEQVESLRQDAAKHQEVADELAATTDMHNKLRVQLDEALEQMDEQTRWGEEVVAELEQRREQIERLRSDIAERDQVIHERDDKIRKVEAVLEAAETRMTEQDTRASAEYERIKAELEAQLEDTQRELEEHDVRLSAENDRIKGELETQLEKVKKQLKEQQQTYEQEKAEWTKTAESNQSLIDELEQQKTQLDEERDALEKEKAELASRPSETGGSSEELEEAKQQLEKFEQEREQWNVDRAWFEQELEARGRIADESTQDKTEIEQRLVDAQQERDQLELALLELRQYVSDAQGSPAPSQPIPAAAPSSPVAAEPAPPVEPTPAVEPEPVAQHEPLAEPVSEQPATPQHRDQQVDAVGSFLDAWRDSETDESGKQPEFESPSELDSETPGGFEAIREPETPSEVALNEVTPEEQIDSAGAGTDDDGLTATLNEIAASLENDSPEPTPAPAPQAGLDPPASVSDLLAGADTHSPLESPLDDQFSSAAEGEGEGDLVRGLDVDSTYDLDALQMNSEAMNHSRIDDYQDTPADASALAGDMDVEDESLMMGGGLSDAAPTSAEDLAFEHPNDAPPVSTADILAKYGCDLEDDAPNAVSDPTPATPSPSEAPASMSDERWNEAIAEDSEGGAEDDIASYMDSLLKRMRGDEPGESSPAPVAKPVAAPKAVEKEEPKQAPAATPETPLKPEEYTPRSAAPERDMSLAEMRALANSQADRAIGAHTKRSEAQTAQHKMICAGLLVCVSGAVLYFGEGSPYSIAAAFLSVGVAGYWLYGAALSSRNSRKVELGDDGAEKGESPSRLDRMTSSKTSPTSDEEGESKESPTAIDDIEQMDDFEEKVLGS